MPARKRKTEKLNHNHQLNLINPDITPTALSQLEKVLEGVHGDDKATVIEETQALLAARGDAGMSSLSMGEHLEKVRRILEPQEKFLDYLKALPRFSQATAYRMIWSWENAQRILSPVTLRVAMVEGYNRIISNEKGGDWATPFKQAAKNVISRIGNPPEDTTENAHAWLAELMKEKRVLSKAQTRGSPPKSVTEVLFVKRFLQTLKRIPLAEQQEFVQHVIGMILKATNFPSYKAKPAATVPAEVFETQRRQPQRVAAA